MSRKYWDLMKNNIEHTFDIDIYDTPLKETTISTIVLGCKATYIKENMYELKVYRLDLKDTPPFNVDTYTLYEYLPNEIDFQDVVKKSSTDFDDNMIEHLNEVVFIASTGPQDDHHCPNNKLPKSIQRVFYPHFVLRGNFSSRGRNLTNWNIPHKLLKFSQSTRIITNYKY